MTSVRRDELLPAIVAHGLPGAMLELPARPLDDAAWGAMLRQVAGQRVAGHLVRALADGALPATAAQTDEAVALHVGAMGLAVRLERTMLRAVASLEGAGVDYRVLKGSAVAHTSYPAPWLRSFGDVDLLVPPETFDEAVTALLADGCRRDRPQLRAGFDRRFAKCVTLRTADGHEIDLHRTFVMGPFGLTVELASLFVAAEPFTVGGRQVLALDPASRFLHACYNAALGDVPPRLSGLRDVAELLLHADVDVEAVLDRAAAWRGQVVVARAVVLAWDTFALADAIPLSVWAQRYQPDARERRALAPYLGSRRTWEAKAFASLRVIPGVADKVAFLRALTVPERAVIEARPSGGHVGRWARGRRDLRRRRR